MKLVANKNFKPIKSHIKLEYDRVVNVEMLEFDQLLTKEESDKVGEVMLAYEQEKQRLLKRLAELNDVQVLNSHIAGQPLGIVVPISDVPKIKQQLIP